jgi:hypothetical protein
MNFFFFLYLSLVFWFFIWVRPRVNDGTIEVIYDNQLQQIKKYIKRTLK